MQKIDTLDPSFREVINDIRGDFERETGYALGVVSARRTIAEQDAIYQESHDGDGIGDGVTNAKGGQSAHNFGLGVDVCPMKSPKEPWWDAPKWLWDKLGELVEAHSLTWGGNFKKLHDVPHIEDPRWKQVQALWKDGKVKVA